MNDVTVPPGPVLSRRGFTTAGLLLTTGLAASACGGTPRTAAGRSGTLRIGFSRPNSLDPAKINQAFEWYVNLAYDPLIYKAPDGALRPRLATAWRYAGGRNTEFELTLRENVTFSDGTPLDADAVKANIDYYRKAGGQAVSLLTPIASVQAVTPLTVRLKLSEPHPQLPTVFSQDYLAGNLISPAAIAAPQTLATRTYGAGPYMLSPGETVADDHYTYVRNPKYWNPRDVHYQKVFVKVLPNPSTALAALKTGQVDVIQGDFTTAGSAGSAGLRVSHVPQVFVGLALADRDGKICRPLADVRVRRALNYAVDRQKITKALLGPYGIPTEQAAAPGRDGYNATAFYRHDPAEARRLLAEAGHAGGFTLPVLSIAGSFGAIGLVTQAMSGDLERIGVRLKTTTVNDAAQYVDQLTSGRFPAYGIGYGLQPIYLMGRGLFLPDAPVFNPMRSSDPVLIDLDRKAASASDADRPGLERRIIRRLVEQAWFVPVSLSPVFFFARDSVAGIRPTPAQPIANPVSWYPAR